MSTFRAGFGRTNITPPMGISISGYYIPRNADGILDDLEATALAVELDGKAVILISLDHLHIKQGLATELRGMIAKATGVEADAVFIHCTHTHTGPHLSDETDEELNKRHTDFVITRVIDAATFAMADLKPAKMGFGIGQAPGVAFVRRFRMKDGSVRTNPGVNNPDIVHPIGDIDERVSVVRFDREGAESLVLVNFGNHPDVVGGCKISADWPGLTRRTVEKAIDNTKCIFFNGAQGDINHVNVHPKAGDLNDMFIDFDDVSRGYGHSKYIARVVTGGVLQAYDKVEYVDVENIDFMVKRIELPSQMPTADEIPEAIRINDLHEAGRDSELPYEGMMLTTVVADAARKIRLMNGPETFGMPLSGIKIGPVALIGIPGEPFNGIGKAIKDTEGYGLIIPCCLTNGGEGYFPMQDAYDEGGYEARSSNFKAGVAEHLITEAKTMLKDME